MQDWRSAATAVRSLVGSENIPVLLRSGFVESRRSPWLEAKEPASFLLAPFTFYPVGGALLPLPWSVAEDTEAYLEKIAERLEGHNRFVLVTNGSPTEFRDWFNRRLATFGFAPHPPATFGRVSVVVFDHRPP